MKLNKKKRDIIESIKLKKQQLESVEINDEVQTTVTLAQASALKSMKEREEKLKKILKKQKKQKKSSLKNKRLVKKTKHLKLMT